MRLCLLAVMLVALLAGASCIGTSSGPPPAVELAVLNHELVKSEAGDVAVRVTVKNIGTVTAELAEVTVSFFDADKGLIDSSRDAVMNLEPDATWIFEIACQGERRGAVASYEIKTTAGASSGGF